MLFNLSLRYKLVYYSLKEVLKEHEFINCKEKAFNKIPSRLYLHRSRSLLLKIMNYKFDTQSRGLGFI